MRARLAVAAAALALCSCQMAQKLANPSSLSLADLEEGARTVGDAQKCAALGDPKVAAPEEYALGGAVATRWVQRGGGLFLEPAKAPGAAGKVNAVSVYLNRVGKNLAAQSSRPALEWTFGVLESPAVNAVSSPGGYVLVTRGLLDTVQNEAQLAGVLAHEIAHVTERHALRVYASVKRNQCAAALGARVAMSEADAFRSALGAPGGFLDLDGNVGLLTQLTDKVVEQVTTGGFAQSDELDADQRALALVISAGYNPEEYIALLGRLPQGDAGYKNHPPNAERQAHARAWLAQQKPRAGEFSDVDPEWATLPRVPFKGQLDAARLAKRP
ncbi:M48 family metalloprotease [Aggregicoccus sp. 17bor-14]|uniref:M48 family metallopeptidase n=1 Tax=Myxococcaceae TaxID=31 RepID=UPI00129C7518|nr:MULTISPECIES: M48 family metallopeptidase [Myxococcaceae]MBF5043483.1 M48 family metalloprotease [Simulacricoccus sp. 17bor-14]MRI89241.1 M48 family metalloprotease [Aggregicoccus sp. 17bor-14]